MNSVWFQRRREYDHISNWTQTNSRIYPSSLQLETTNADKRTQYRILLNQTKNCIVIVLSRLIWHQTEFCMVPNQSKNVVTILGLFNLTWLKKNSSVCSTIFFSQITLRWRINIIILAAKFQEFLIKRTTIFSRQCERKWKYSFLSADV